ncbi:MAG: PH domain-containing protein [Patescibacteria group bacterium]
MKSLFSIFKDTYNSFENKEAGEEVLILIRRHPFFIILQLVLFMVLFLLPLILGIFFSPFLLFNNLVGISLLLYSLWCLILWQMMFYLITMYALDVWIVTDRRIIDSTQHGFFNRSISELHLSRIQDISVKTDGLIQTFFKFGDLEIQTAGTENKFKFLQIPRPNNVKNQIMSHISSNIHSTDKPYGNPV